MSLVVAVIFPDVQHAHGVLRRTLQNPQGILHPLIGHRAVQGIEDVVGLGLPKVGQHDEAHGVLTMQVLKRSEHPVDVMVGFLATSLGRRLNSGENVDDNEAVATARDVSSQLLQASVIEQGKVVEKLQLAVGPDAWPDFLQTALNSGPAVFEGDVKDRLRLWHVKMPPDTVSRGDGQGKVEHEP